MRKKYKQSEVIQNISNSINIDMQNAKVYVSNSGSISVSKATIGKELDIQNILAYDYHILNFATFYKRKSYLIE